MRKSTTQSCYRIVQDSEEFLETKNGNRTLDQIREYFFTPFVEVQ